VPQFYKATVPATQLQLSKRFPIQSSLAKPRGSRFQIPGSETAYRSSLGPRERELHYSVQNARGGGVETRELYIR
jgi:hypothetical protein